MFLPTFSITYRHVAALIFSFTLRLSIPPSERRVFEPTSFIRPSSLFNFTGTYKQVDVYAQLDRGGQEK